MCSSDLCAKHDDRRIALCPDRAFVLQHFTGKFTLAKVQQRYERKRNGTDPQFVANFIDELIDRGVLAFDPHDTLPDRPVGSLRACVEWDLQPEGYWILNNPVAGKAMEVAPEDRGAIADLGWFPDRKLCETHGLRPPTLEMLRKYHGPCAMLEGVEPPEQKRGKLNPMQLLFFTVKLCDPDPWLSRHVGKLHWIWTRSFWYGFLACLSLMGVVGLTQAPALIEYGVELWASQGAGLLLKYIVAGLVVLSIHELGHAFTLRHFGKPVTNMGLMFMCLFPAAYTDSTNSYGLSRQKRMLVVAAGVLTQLAIAAIALLAWNFTTAGHWLAETSHLMLTASLVTVLLNLNPLAKFDGYHLLVAATRINGLRGRAIAFYQRKFKGEAEIEPPHHRPILAAYAPVSLVYIVIIFGVLFGNLFHFALTTLSAPVMLLFLLWLTYYTLWESPAS